MRWAARVVVAIVCLSSCNGSSPGAATAPAGPPPTADRCVVGLHGKGDRGAAGTVDAAGVAHLAPTGNAPGWNDRQWLYFPDDQYDAARAIVESAITGSSCRQVIIDGFSNGGAFAAKMYCNAETFGGTVVGYVIDDPVPDAATAGCAPSPGIAATVYWTGALAATATAGWNCSERDWTCEGGSTIGIDAYAAALGVPITASAFTTHTWFRDAPTLAVWPTT